MNSNLRSSASSNNKAHGTILENKENEKTTHITNYSRRCNDTPLLGLGRARLARKGEKVMPREEAKEMSREEDRSRRHGARSRGEQCAGGFDPDPDEGWDRRVRCGACLTLGRGQYFPCPLHGDAPPVPLPMRAPQSRPTHSHAGVRIGEAAKPGPGQGTKGQKGKLKNNKGKHRAASKMKARLARLEKVEEKEREMKHAVDATSDDGNEEAKEPFVPITICILSRLPASNARGVVLVGWKDGELVTDRGNRHYYTHSGQPVRSQTLDETPTPLIGFKELAPGWYEQLEPQVEPAHWEGAWSEAQVTPTEAFAEVTTPTITINGVRYLGEDRIVLRPLLDKLASLFPNPVITETNIRAFTAFANRDFGTLPIAVLAHTIQLYVIQCYQRQQATKADVVLAIKAAAMPDKGLRTYFNPSGIEAKQTMLELGVDFDVSGFHRLNGQQDSLEQIREENGNFNLVSYSGYTPFEHGLGHIAGTFDTPANEFPKVYYTQAMTIQGVKGFTVLDKSGRNVAHALSRMYKAREDEATLRANQLALLRVGQVRREILEVTTNKPKATLALFPEPGCFGERAVELGEEADTDDQTELVRQVIHPHFLEMKRSVDYWLWTVRFVSLALFLYCAVAAREWYVGLAATLFMVGGVTTIGSTFTMLTRIFPKAKLYKAWFLEVLLGLGHTYEEPLRDKVEAKFKVELAKPRKHGRLFVSYGRSILQAGWIFESIKTIFCVVHDVGEIVRGRLPFLGGYVPNAKVHIYKSLDESENLREMLHAEGLTARVYSDDMSLTYNRNGISCAFDADISSCDAGNGTAMFYLLGILFHLYGYGAFFANQMRRLREVITVRNPSNKREFIKIEPSTIFQGSGCPETTIVNDVASFCIVVAFVVFIAYSDWKNAESFPLLSFSKGTDDTRKLILQRAARAVGHKVTISFRNNLAELQFLKYSPLTSSTGELVNTRNLGAILRNLGRVEGDLSAEKVGLSTAQFRLLTPAARFERYVAGVVKGLCNEPQHCVMDALRARFGSGDFTAPNSHEDVQIKTDRSCHVIPLSSLQERYGGEDHEWTQLVEAIHTLTYGSTKFSSMVDKIMEIDYDL